MDAMCKALAVVAAVSCCAVGAKAQQRPEYGGGQTPNQVPRIVVDRPPAPGLPPPNLARAGTPSSSDELIRKQTEAILELSQKLDRLDRRVSELEARGKK
jgi:hypothetical protein